ncbi:MAG: hypothetical protein KatS3mg108_0524 [Isosphaeraceae bacterium]|jgi:uncharacterized protein YbaR (Trm112 family)|nr:MAG: hypothetical protein KatS3mg108_0524 [Isosphaeraceae bacterium]
MSNPTTPEPSHDPSVSAGSSGRSPIEDLLDRLVCPMAHAPLRREGEWLVCTRCGPRFAIVDDIPNMIIEEATLPEGCADLRRLPCVLAGDARLD